MRLLTEAPSPYDLVIGGTLYPSSFTHSFNYISYYIVGLWLNKLNKQGIFVVKVVVLRAGSSTDEINKISLKYSYLYIRVGRKILRNRPKIIG